MFMDRVVGVVAPFECLMCGAEGEIVCSRCVKSIVINKRSTCYLCNRLNSGWRTCLTCRRKSKIAGVIIVSHYEGVIKELIQRLKYRQAAAAARVLADSLLPYITTSQYDLITWVPASTKRQRQRGYNQARLIAKYVASNLKLPARPTLGKLGQRHQVGTSRRQRLEQVKNTMYPLRNHSLEGKRILIIDDVVTTGATMTEAARALKTMGAKTIWGAAVAKH